MATPDELLVEIAATVEAEQMTQMALTVVLPGAVITGRLAPERVWRQHVAELLQDSDQLGPFAGIFRTTRQGGPRPGGTDPTHLHSHMARILQGQVGIPDTGGMHRVAIEEVSAWAAGDFAYVEP